MKIWIDLTNSPHINFFKPFIKQWKREGIDIIITTRDLANTIDLIKQNDWKYYEVGGHAGKNKFKKILYFLKRVFLLRRFLRNFKPDIGISHSSFYSPVVSKLIGIPSIYLNDNEHAKGNYLAFNFSSLNLLPDSLKKKAYELGWIKKYKMDFYPGIKEGVYLSQLNWANQIFSNDKKKKSIYIRLEPWTAQYYSGSNHFIDDLIKELKEDYHIVILPRGNKQAVHYNNKSFLGIEIAKKPLFLEEIFIDCDLFIGAGGSMTREIAFLKIPTISIYQDELLEVDKYLIKNKLMFHKKNLNKKEVELMLNSKPGKINLNLKAKGVDAFRLINNTVKKYAKN